MRDRLIAACRLVLGLLVLGAFTYLVASRWGTPSFRISNLLSYFTIESNLFAAVVLIVAAFGVWPGRPRTFEYLRGAAVLYLVATGVVYGVLLSGYDAIAQTAPPFVNTVMHRILPVAIAVDWVLSPPRVSLSLKRALSWLVFPLGYLAYTLVRGPVADWYPYPFLDPAHPGGYGRVALMSTAVAIGFVVLTVVIVWAGNRLGGPGAHAARPAPPPRPPAVED